ncbi:MAG: hypothetical protein FWC03_01580 [Treponema sp.]|nr:hypothetical protein [Treponema sp.]
MINYFDIKDKSIFLGWIIGLLFLISLIWVLSQNAQAHNLLRTVNNIFITSGDSRRLVSQARQVNAKAGPLGYWYNMNSTDKMFVFGVFQDGILVPLGAIVSANGRVNEVIPLSAHAAQTFGNISQSILKVYITRIESAALVSFAETQGRNR